MKKISEKAIRYYKQPNNYSCGAFAVLNILKWCNQKFFFSDWKKIAKICKTSKEGTEDRNLEKGLRKLTKKYLIIKKRKKFTVKEVQNHLENNGVIIVGASQDHYGNENYHYFLIIKMDKKYFLAVNYFKNKIFYFLRKRNLKKLKPFIVYYINKRMEE